jgi:hypothetical protein
VHATIGGTHHWQVRARAVGSGHREPGPWGWSGPGLEEPSRTDRVNARLGRISSGRNRTSVDNCR